jgi:hypothetical protein
MRSESLTPLLQEFFLDLHGYFNDCDVIRYGRSMRWTGYSPGPYRLSVIAHFAIASINTQSSEASYRSSSGSPGSLNSVLNDFGLKGSATLRLRSYTDLQGQLSARRFPRRVGDRQLRVLVLPGQEKS